MAYIVRLRYEGVSGDFVDQTCLLLYIGRSAETADGDVAQTGRSHRTRVFSAPRGDHRQSAQAAAPRTIGSGML